MAGRPVNLQPIVAANLGDCLALDVAADQRTLVASNAKSLAEAYVDPTLTPLAVYDADALGYLPPDTPSPMRGFVMFEVKGGVGFLLRLMIDERFQGLGYGRGAAIEVIRRLRSRQDVELIATSHRAENDASARLFASLGFVDWPVGWAEDQSDEVFLMLPDRSETPRT